MCSQPSPVPWGPTAGWTTKDDTLSSCPHTTSEDYKRIAQVLHGRLEMHQALADASIPREASRERCPHMYEVDVASVCRSMGPIHVCSCATIEAALACLGFGSLDEASNKGLRLVRLKCGGRPPPCPCPGECTGYQDAVYRNDVIGVLRGEIASLRRDLESKNLQIKKMCERVDSEASHTRKIAIGLSSLKMLNEAGDLMTIAGRLSTLAGEGIGEGSDDEVAFSRA